MEPHTLSLRGIEAWLQDTTGERLPFASGAPKVDGNTIAVVMEVENSKRFSVNWRKIPAAPAINAWCEIFRPTGRGGIMKIKRVANHSMDENLPVTQSRSSRGRLEPPLLPDQWLWTPRSGEGYIMLEIRRLHQPPKDIILCVENTPEEAPYIVFRFEFQLNQSIRGSFG
ncbi:hypothetical protein C8R46DRAFT_1026360 [Mycena filopes]|nr:hypothetical protein C8R46DRAFT_1026360 [Mycena filopes]